MTITLLAITGLLVATLVSAHALRDRHPMLRVAVCGLLFAVMTTSLTGQLGSPLEPRFMRADWALALWQQALLASWWFVAARILAVISQATLRLRAGSPQAKLLSDLWAGLLYFAAAGIVINSILGVPLKSLVATSGVIAIGLGFALQNTLADVFAGITVGVERPYAIGDRIQLDGLIEGEVVQANWRSIRIRTDNDGVATVPNSLVAKSRILNRSSPVGERGVTITVGADAGHRPDMVLELLRRATLLCPGILPQPPPTMLLTRLGQRTHAYDVSFRVADTAAIGKVRGMLLQQVARLFSHAGVRFAGERDTAGALGRDRTVEEGLRLLAETSVLSALSPEHLADLGPGLIWRDLDADEVLFEEGEPGDSLYILVGGVLEATRQAVANLGALGRLGPGDTFGELGLLTGEPHPTTMTAITPSTLLVLPKAALEPLLREEPNLVSALERALRQKQHLIARHVLESSAGSAGAASQILERIRAFFRLDAKPT